MLEDKLMYSFVICVQLLIQLDPVTIQLLQQLLAFSLTILNSTLIGISIFYCSILLCGFYAVPTVGLAVFLHIYAPLHLWVK